MFDLMKIVGMSAVLSAGLVTVSEMQASPEPVSGKIYTDRVSDGEAVPQHSWNVSYAARSRSEAHATPSKEAKGDLLRRTPQGACSAQAWPNIAPECLVAADGASDRGSVRMVTVEQRSGANTSVLVRIPASTIAQR